MDWPFAWRCLRSAGCVLLSVLPACTKRGEGYDLYTIRRERTNRPGSREQRNQPPYGRNAGMGGGFRARGSELLRDFSCPGKRRTDFVVVRLVFGRDFFFMISVLHATSQ